MINEDERLWNVYVRTDNYQEREYTILDTEENIREAMKQVKAFPHVIDSSYGPEHADTTGFDLVEMVGQWIDGEY